jgi:hypothetical protein
VVGVVTKKPPDPVGFAKDLGKWLTSVFLRLCDFYSPHFAKLLRFPPTIPSTPSLLHSTTPSF